MNWLNENWIEVLSRTGNSSDINPIKNLWYNMKQKVNKGNLTNMQDLKQAIARSWCLEVMPVECQRLVELMPRLITAVIRINGYPTKY